MLIKSLSFTLLSLCLAQGLSAADEPAVEQEKSNARAYRAHLLSFIWPEKMSSEQIDYQNIYDIEGIPRFLNEEDAIQSASIMDKTALDSELTENVNPFYQYQELVGKKVEVLVNQTWPMVFEEQGSVNIAEFHSPKRFDGYPELTGQISIKLGRYLETEIDYKHYLFDSFSAPVQEEVTEENIDGLIFDELDPFEELPATEKKTVKLYEPALLLSFTSKRKTASKKLNYLDHPIIGSLLYFEPISVDDAEHELMLQALTEEEMVRDAEASISLEPEENSTIFLPPPTFENTP